mmetsp:Transcript_28991/g.51839  ORF Transcript_28991/g.51839 Transcript_28991/m.51839 type:complete len:310 (-) Transcript_28991:6-935(-)
MIAETYVIIATAALYLAFLYSLMSFTSIVLMHSIPLPILYIAYLRLKELRTAGLLNKLPTSVQDAMFNKSVIDVVAQLVAGGSLAKFLKAVFLPCVFEMDRVEVHRLYSHVSPTLAETMTTKGIINTVPLSVQQFLLPADPYADQRLLPTNPTPVAPPKINRTAISTQLTSQGMPKTQLISSGGPRKQSSVNQRINEITTKIPSLKPLVTKMLSDKMRAVMSSVSNTGLKKASIVTLILFSCQLFLSRRMRRWTLSWIKMAFLAGTVSVLAASLSGLFIKYLHSQSEPSERESEKRLKHRFEPSLLAFF